MPTMLAIQNGVQLCHVTKWGWRLSCTFFQSDINLAAVPWTRNIFWNLILEYNTWDCAELGGVMITHLEICPNLYSSATLSCCYWEPWFTDLHSVLIVQADQFTTAPEAHSKLPYVSEQCSRVMLIQMRFAELPGLYHVLELQPASVVKSSSSFWSFWQNWSRKHSSLGSGVRSGHFGFYLFQKFSNGYCFSRWVTWECLHWLTAVPMLTEKHFSLVPKS